MRGLPRVVVAAVRGMGGVQALVAQKARGTSGVGIHEGLRWGMGVGREEGGSRGPRAGRWRLHVLPLDWQVLLHGLSLLPVLGRGLLHKGLGGGRGQPPA